MVSIFCKFLCSNCILIIFFIQTICAQTWQGNSNLSTNSFNVYLTENQITATEKYDTLLNKTTIVISEIQSAQPPATLTLEEVQARMASYFYSGDWQQLQTAAKTNNKIYFVDFVTNWCQVCREMDNKVFASENFSKFVTQNNILAYKLNADKQSDIADYYGIEYYPTIIFFNANGQELGRTTGYTSEDILVQHLKHYKPKVPHTKYSSFR